MPLRDKNAFIFILLLLLGLACGLGDIPGISNDNPSEATPTAESGSGVTTSDDSNTIEQATASPTEPADEETESSPTESNNETTEENSGEPPSTQPEINSANLAERQIFILPGGEPPTLDPHLSGDATSAEYVVEVFSGLLAYDPDLNLVPDIAESYEVSDDGLVYTFTIREEAQFQDDKPIRAEDFKWSLERACDPATNSRTADTYLGDIIGCRDKLQGQADEVEGVVVVDDLTLELTIDEPKGFFPAKMTYPTAYVLDQENVESGGPTWFETPNGSGPFGLTQYDPENGLIILEKNDNFYREPKPILERVVFLINAPVDLMNGYTEGLDSIGLDGFSYQTIPVGTSNLSAVTDPNNPLSKEYVSTEELSVFYIGFNVNRPPFDDPKVRQAFNLALDKERMVRLVFQGLVPVANGIVPPTMPNYENPDLSDFEFNPERALELIAESSYGDVSELPDITLNLSGTGGGVGALTEAIIESYKVNLGIEIAVEQASWEEFLEDLDKQPDMPYQMYQLGWVADYPDPQDFLEILFDSTSRQNYGGYNNPEVDALLDEARGLPDAEERLAVYQEVEQLLLEDAAWVPLYFSVDAVLVKPYVQNFVQPPIKIPRFQYMWLAEHDE
jgi:oligopeptide transport system substrate-binding protein